MCGISGIISKTGKSQDNAIRSMAKAIRHRGPDAKGFYHKGRVCLGHNRLSIIDLTKEANQPMFNETGNLILLFNGEIYNYKELREDLIKKGHAFRSNTDSEVVLHSYEEFGEECVKRFRGAFAFAIYDEKEEKIFLVRDRMGIKPLYYVNNRQVFAFCSEAKGFLKLDLNDFSPELSEDSLKTLLSFPFIPDNQATIFKGVYKVPAGHTLVYKDGQIKIKRYWELNTEVDENLSLKDACKELEDLLIKSVGLRLQADVPVGILLSGGLDSSLIAALAKVNTPNVQTFTVGYEHSWDERPFAEKVAEHIGSDHKAIELDPMEINNRIEEVVLTFDDVSTLDPGILSNYLIAEKIRENSNVKVLLVGEGADELFGGYSWYGVSQLPFRLLPQALRTFIHYYAISRRLSFAGFSLMKDLYKTLEVRDIFNQVTNFEIKYQLPNNYLMKMDKAAMAHSLEARVPYLDHLIVEKALSLPASYKLKGHWFNMKEANEKYILREIARKYLPEEIVSRKKRGFGLPIPQVLKSNMPKIKDYLLAKNSLALSLFSKKKIESLFNFKTCLYSPFEKEKEVLLWKLYILEVWNNYVKGK